MVRRDDAGEEAEEGKFKGLSGRGVVINALFCKGDATSRCFWG